MCLSMKKTDSSYTKILNRVLVFGGFSAKIYSTQTHQSPITTCWGNCTIFNHGQWSPTFIYYFKRLLLKKATWHKLLIFTRSSNPQNDQILKAAVTKLLVPVRTTDLFKLQSHLAALPNSTPVICDLIHTSYTLSNDSTSHTLKMFSLKKLTPAIKSKAIKL